MAATKSEGISTELGNKEKMPETLLPNGFAKDEKSSPDISTNSHEKVKKSDENVVNTKVNSSEDISKTPQAAPKRIGRRSRSKSGNSEDSSNAAKNQDDSKVSSSEKAVEEPKSSSVDSNNLIEDSKDKPDLEKQDKVNEALPTSRVEKKSRRVRESQASEVDVKKVEDGVESSDDKSTSKLADFKEPLKSGEDKPEKSGDESSPIKDDFMGFDDLIQSETARLCYKFLEVVDPYVKPDSNKSTKGEVENGSPSMFNPVVKLETLKSTSKVNSSRPRKSTSAKSNSIAGDPNYLKPFNYGWVRELVYRNTPAMGSRKAADLYYYSPTNKKLRSAKEVAEYLITIDCQDLTTENFTFYKEPLGLDDPSKEIIRQSKPTKSASGFSSDQDTPIKKMPKAKTSMKTTISSPAPVSPPSTSSNTTPRIAFKTTAVSKKAQAKRANAKAAIKKRRSAGPDDISMSMDDCSWSPDKSPQTNGVKRSAGENDDSPPAKVSKISTPPKDKSPTQSVTTTSTSSPPPPPPQVPVAVPPVPLPPPNYWGVISSGYTALFHAFQYLKVHELLRAACVNRMWRHLASHRSLWETVRMKNTRVRDWSGFGRTLSERGTRSLDLRKMLVPESSEATVEMWNGVASALANVPSIRRVDLGRCIPEAVEMVVKACPQLEALVALTIRGPNLDASCLKGLKNLEELKLKSVGTFEITNLKELKHLTNLKHLAITTCKRLPGIEEILPETLESLELGECSDLAEVVATAALPKLVNLRRLRLEKGQGQACPTIQILNAVAALPNLKQLELINFDVKPGFEKALAQCIHLRTLLIIPTYVTQSATTNHVVMGGVSKLANTLTYFIWGLTLELLRVTDLFIDQVEAQKTKSVKPKKGSGDSIPILKPLTEEPQESSKAAGQTTSQVDILALPKLQKVLSTLLPTTKIKILKVPFSATWRQTVDP